MQLIPEILKPEIHPFWRYWNLGSFKYFQTAKQIGNAKIEPFHIDEERESHELLNAALSSHSGGRWVPRGEYVKLMKFQTDAHDLAEGPVWQTVMSDTPDEANDHLHPLLNAHGRVLIHGLGLGCALKCILMRPDVTHIDVVEIDEDVLNLISPFFEKSMDRITFHHGSCTEIVWPKGMRWNYIWHDIWSTIAAHNLVDDSQAEHGISYATLHRKFGGRCDMQASWAFEQARQMREIERLIEDIAHRFAVAFNLSSEQERIEMLIEATCPIGIEMDQWRFFLTNEDLRKLTGVHSEMFERYKQRAMHGDMEYLEAYVILEDRARRYAQQKVGMIGASPSQS